MERLFYYIKYMTRDFQTRFLRVPTQTRGFRREGPVQQKVWPFEGSAMHG